MEPIGQGKGVQGAEHTPRTRPNPGRRLDSWKAIAQYLDRDVRSAQRWERDRRLPVHRLPGGGAVFAYEGELDEWLTSGQVEASDGIEARTSTNAEVGFVEGSAKNFLGATTRLRLTLIVAAVVGVTVLAFLAFLSRLNHNLATSFRPNTIAVLPMQNLSGDLAEDYFVDGFTEELTTELAQVHALRVISRTSTMSYKGTKKPLPQIANELQVKYVLEGSVILDGPRVRVTAQLIDAPSDTHLWARSYDSDVKGVLDIQSQISRAIVTDVSLDLSPSERQRLASVPTVDADAHDLYLRASYQFGQQTPDSIRRSLELYRQAAAKDPSFAMAYLGIAQAEAAMLQITAESPGDAIETEKDALAKALAINPHLGDAYGLLASLSYYHDWDWPRAEHEFQAALAEGARAPTEQRYGSALITRGRFDEGTAHLQSALELDPLGKSPLVSQFYGFYFQRKYPEARRKLEGTLVSSPEWLAGHGLLSLVAATQRDCTEAEKQAQWMSQKYPSPFTDVLLSFASACRGDQVKARNHLEQAASYKGPAFVSPYQLALGYSFLGDKENALRYLQKSADIREPQVTYIKVDPLFDGLRSDPRYVALAQKLGLL